MKRETKSLEGTRSVERTKRNEKLTNERKGKERKGRTLPIHNRKPIRRDAEIAQDVHGGNVRQRRDGEELAWGEGL